MYQIVDDMSQHRVDQATVTKMNTEFRAKSADLRNSLKEKFSELKTMLKI